MVDIGDLTITFAFLVAAYGLIAFILGARRGNEALKESARNSQYALAGLLSISSAAMVYALVSRDFSVEYVASYSSRDMSIFYTVAAFWGGQKGSLLLWVWMLSIFAGIVTYQNREKNEQIMPYVGAVMSGTALFFMTLLVFSTPPFERVIPPPADGHGLNPLLRNADMVSHPLTLYLGFVGFTVPFAFALAALIAGRLDDQWLLSTRKWTIFSWFFLMLGNLFGAQWAYVELGWGGFWAWDPVENASFMPWLTGTAYLHSVMIQERRGMLKVWNMVLIILTFFLTIFGTFITRSGIISSVHSFGKSTLGPFFFGFMGLSLFIALYFLFSRMHLLKSRNELDGILSREASFLVNNLLLVGVAFAVFWGTVFPFISEAVRGVKITVSVPFFNQVVAPLGLALILVTGICPLVSWRRASKVNLIQSFLYPVSVGVVAALVLFIVGVRHSYALIALSLSAFVVTTIVLEFVQGSAAKAKTLKVGYLTGFKELVVNNKRRYGGYIIHVGVIMMVLGVTGAMAFKTEMDSKLQVGQTFTMNGYTFKYEGMDRRTERDRFVVEATVTVTNAGKPVAILKPQKNFYEREEQPITEVAIRSTLKEDLYAILAGWDGQGTVHFKFLINPLVMWLWIGGAVMALGTIVVMWPDRKAQVARGRGGEG